MSPTFFVKKLGQKTGGPCPPSGYRPSEPMVPQAFAPSPRLSRSVLNFASRCSAKEKDAGAGIITYFFCKKTRPKNWWAFAHSFAQPTIFARFTRKKKKMQVPGFEPGLLAWKAKVLPGWTTPAVLMCSPGSPAVLKTFLLSHHPHRFFFASSSTSITGRGVRV